MKKLILLSIVLAPTFFVSCKSKEEKALELINDYMFKSLYDYESYQSVETKIDSAYMSAYIDSTCIAAATLAMIADKEAKGYQEKADGAKSSMNIWEDSYSSYGLSKYYEARDEYKEASKMSIKMLSLVLSSTVSIWERADTLSKDFCGWKVEHKFRCKNKGGQPSIGDYTFIIDPDFKSIINTFDKDDDDIKAIKSKIDMALECNEHDILT